MPTDWFQMLGKYINNPVLSTDGVAGVCLGAPDPSRLVPIYHVLEFATYRPT